MLIGNSENNCASTSYRTVQPNQTDNRKNCVVVAEVNISGNNKCQALYKPVRLIHFITYLQYFPIVIFLLKLLHSEIIFRTQMTVIRSSTQQSLCETRHCYIDSITSVLSPTSITRPSLSSTCHHCQAAICLWFAFEEKAWRVKNILK